MTTQWAVQVRTDQGWRRYDVYPTFHAAMLVVSSFTEEHGFDPLSVRVASV